MATEFRRLTSTRRVGPEGTLVDLGKLASVAVRFLQDEALPHPMKWCGTGAKVYRAYTPSDTVNRWSRGVNEALFIQDPASFLERWNVFAAEVVADQSTMVMKNVDVAEIDKLFYTAVMAYACLTDLVAPNRAGPGTFLEMLVGPTIALLLGRPESGEIPIPVPGTAEIERVKVDLTFESPKPNSRHLVIPTKISTRERISQAFVHQRILDAARPGEYRSVLCVGNENNARHTNGVLARDRSVNTLELVDTLVPGTIALYQRYVAQLSGLYYLDAPTRYITGDIPGLPPVKTFGTLLTGDLVMLL